MLFKKKDILTIFSAKNWFYPLIRNGSTHWRNFVEAELPSRNHLNLKKSIILDSRQWLFWPLAGIWQGQDQVSNSEETKCQRSGYPWIYPLFYLHPLILSLSNNLSALSYKHVNCICFFWTHRQHGLILFLKLLKLLP